MYETASWGQLKSDGLVGLHFSILILCMEQASPTMLQIIWAIIQKLQMRITVMPKVRNMTITYAAVGDDQMDIFKVV